MVWSVLITRILHKGNADFKRFLGARYGDLQGPQNPDLCGVLSGKTDRTKRRNQSVSGDDAGLIYPNIVLGLWPVIFGFTGQYLPALPLDPNWFPADRRRSFVAPRPSEIKAKAAGRHGLT